jgi:hypothetical protein
VTADVDDSRGELHCVICSLEGKNLRKDAASAIKHFGRSAEQENVIAKGNLGESHDIENRLIS